MAPRIVVRRERTLEPAADLEVVALAADGGPLGPVAGQAEVVDIDRRGFHPVAEVDALLRRLDLVDGDLRGGGQRGRQGGDQDEERIKSFHCEEFTIDDESRQPQIYEFIYKIVNFVRR